VDLLQLADGDLGVDLRGRDAGVAELVAVSAAATRLRKGG